MPLCSSQRRYDIKNGLRDGREPKISLPCHLSPREKNLFYLNYLDNRVYLQCKNSFSLFFVIIDLLQYLLEIFIAMLNYLKGFGQLQV
ncbi:hypothetical protein PUN28_001828 [Cardiocondyla obscurior]|uniref:Uncharacterized protein n=1 Tax=Cardiocondyla obscurior TaxID=286306 RepID=A0AAW2GRK5_9HYME